MITLFCGFKQCEQMYLNIITVFGSGANPINCVFKTQQMLFQRLITRMKILVCLFLADLLDPLREAHICLQTKMSPHEAAMSLLGVCSFPDSLCDLPLS